VCGEKEGDTRVAAVEEEAEVEAGPGAAEEFNVVERELKVAVLGVVVDGAALQATCFEGELTVEGFSLFPALEEVLGFFVRVVDFEKEHFVDARGILEFLGGLFASGGCIGFECAGTVLCGVQFSGEGRSVGLGGGEFGAEVF
jgi:hypothetical protein